MMTMIAAEVFSTKPRSALSAQRKICTGNAADASSGVAGIRDKCDHADHQ